jgi:hypothetical protein
MKPAYALNKVHRPEEGIIGDCHRACIASLLELRTEDVPHFFDYPPEQEAERGMKHQRGWLRERGLGLLEFPVAAESLEQFLRWAEQYTEGAYYTLTAKSRSGNNHVVICRGNQVVHDPTFGDEHGIVGPCSDGFWWPGFLVNLSTGDSDR